MVGCGKCLELKGKLYTPMETSQFSLNHVREDPGRCIYLEPHLYFCRSTPQKESLFQSKLGSFRF